MIIRHLLVLVLCAATATLVAAQSASPNAVGEVTSIPAAADDGARPELQEALPQGRLIGKGRLNFFGFHVYDARLWAVPGFKAEGFSTRPLALELHYFRGFDNQAVADRSITEMRRSVPISDEQAEKWKQAMVRVLPDVKKGDRVMGVHRPGVGAVFWMNGKVLGEIRDPEFAKLFFGIWLSPATSQPGLRTALLAGAGT